MENDKRYLKDLSKDELKKVLEVNDKLKNIVFEDWCKDCMQSQEDSGNDLNLTGVRYHDHYESFFHTLIDSKKFIENLNSEPLEEEVQQKHKECEEMINKLYEMDMYDDSYDELDAKIEEKAKSLLEDVDNSLHYYEKAQYDDKEMLQWLYDFELESNSFYEDIYIDDDFKAYEHIHMDYIKAYC